MNLINEQQYEEAKKIRACCVALREEQQGLEEKQRQYEGKKRAKRLAEIAAELDQYGAFASFDPVRASEQVAKWVAAMESSTASAEETIQDFVGKLEMGRIAHTLQWYISDAVVAEVRWGIYKAWVVRLQRLQIDQLLEAVRGTQVEWRNRVINHAQCGNSRSSSQTSNVVEAAQIAVYAELVEGRFYSSPWGKILWELELLEDHDVPVWEDRTFEEECDEIGS
jgi:hypothetical protein